MSWREKSMHSDLFFCTNVDCNVITFRPGPLGNNACPKCHQLGSVVRHRQTLSIQDAIQADKDASHQSKEGTSS